MLPETRDRLPDCVGMLGLSCAVQGRRVPSLEASARASRRPRCQDRRLGGRGGEALLDCDELVVAALGRSRFHQDRPRHERVRYRGDAGGRDARRGGGRHTSDAAQVKLVLFGDTRRLEVPVRDRPDSALQHVLSVSRGHVHVRKLVLWLRNSSRRHLNRPLPLYVSPQSGGPAA